MSFGPARPDVSGIVVAVHQIARERLASPISRALAAILPRTPETLPISALSFRVEFKCFRVKRKFFVGAPAR